MVDSKPLITKKICCVFGIMVVLAVALFLIQQFPLKLLNELEGRTWDWRSAQVAQRSNPDPKIKLIVIDQASLDYFSQQEKIFWPWPRALYESILQFLQRAHARAAAFDILFTEQSSYGVEDDVQFANAVFSGLPVVSSVSGRRVQSKEDTAELGLFRKRQSGVDVTALLGDGNSNRFPSVTLPVMQLLEKSAGFGNVMVDPDSDGVFRRVQLAALTDKIGVLSLPAALHAISSKNDDFSWVSRYANRAGQVVLRFNAPDKTYPAFSFAAVVQSLQAVESGENPSIDLKEFQDSLVFVGMTAPGLLDLRPTPVNPRAAGVEFNATVLDNLRHHDFVREVPWTLAAVTSILLAAIISTLILFTRSVGAHTVIILSGAALLFLTACQLAFAGWWFPLILPGIALALAVLASLAFQFQLEGRQHRFLRNAFRHYVSPSVIDQIVAEPSSLSLGGERKELTIFFSDIEGFTTISEKLPAAALVELLNVFLSEMTAIILSHGGTVDKYVGDAIVAFWNAPLNVPDHATRAVAAAVECQKRLGVLRPELKQKFGIDLRMRIGLHTGSVSVGNFGSKERFNYTVLGDAANLASRLEGANKNFGTYILISENTFAALDGEVLCRKLGALRVVGKNEAVTVFEPMAVSVLNESRLVEFSSAMQCFDNRDFVGAQAGFEPLKAIDPVSRAYLKRIEKELALGSDGQWSAVWGLSEK